MNNTDSQVCTSCPEKGEQPLTNFHHRRNGYQKICKACRNAAARETYKVRGKQTLPHTPNQINIANFPAMQERIVNLESRLRASASVFAHDKLEADDVYSKMVEAVLTKCKPEDSDGFIMQRAKFTGQACLAKRLTYNHYMGSLEVDESEIKIPGTDVQRITEDDIIDQEARKQLYKILDSLPEKHRKIIAMFAIGMNQSQIAKELAVTEQTISERVKRIRMALSRNFQMEELFA
jgi:RNA polymerase sigma factor (sigma-70 family)